MIEEIRKYIQEKISNYKIEDYESEKITVRDSILQTIEYGVSTTVFVVGPAGVGKTVMINKILEEIATGRKIKGQYDVVKFNGYLHETDELAVQHMVKSLNSDLISESALRGSAAGYLEYVTESLRQADGSMKSLVLIFDNFNIFCDNEKRLLYNLLDMVNHQSAAVCVIGIARNGTCLETLHERTQSRLATTNVYICPRTSAENRLSQIQRLFTVDAFVEGRKNWNKTLKEVCQRVEMSELVEKLLQNDTSERFFIQFLYQSLLYIDDQDSLSFDIFKKAFDDFNFDKLKLDYKVRNLTTLDLCLFIAIYHRCTNYETRQFNFEMIYENYNKVVQKASGKLPSVDRLLAMKAFENLKKHGCIRLKRSGDSDSTPIEYDLHELIVPEEKIKESIRKSANLSADLRQWIDNSLHTQ